MFRVVSVFILWASVSAVIADCKIEKNVLGAVYEVSTMAKDSNKVQKRHLTLWRNGNQVAHEHTDDHITEIWEKMSNGLIRLERHFDAHNRGIEYAAREINNGKGYQDWSLKYQLISNQLKQEMKFLNSTGKACDKLERYILQTKGKRFDLLWLPEKYLIAQFTIHTKHADVVWQLTENITQQETVKNVFAARGNYQTTDYIDIGDNESDPFLLRMINLGFVKHGASGFYDSHGNNMNPNQHSH